MADNIGDVGVGVEVDADGVTEELDAEMVVAGRSAGKKLADAISDRLKAGLTGALGPAMDRIKAEVAKTVEEIKHGPEYLAKIDVEARVEEAKVQIWMLKEWAKEQTLDMLGQVDLAKAGAAIAVFTRDRIVKLVPVISKAAAATATAAMATIMQVGRISIITSVIGALGGAILNASQFILGLAGSILAMLPLAALLPGIILAAGAAMGVFAIAMKDAGKQLASLLPEAKSIAQGISDAFWKQAAQPIKDAFKSLGPDIKSSLDPVASAMGGLVGNLATSLKSALGGGGLQAALAGVVPAINAAAKGIQPMVSAFVTLAQVGSGFLPQFGAWIAKIGSEFNTWVQGVAASGALKTMIEGALTQVQLLWSSLQSVWSILTGLIKAAQEAGSGGLATMATVLKEIAAVINGPAFQQTLIAFFRASQTAVAGLMPGIQALGPMFQALSGAIANFLGSGGQVVGSLLAALAKTLSQPIVSEGLNDAINGIAHGFSLITPILPVLAGALGPVLSLFGQLAASVGGILSSALPAIVPIISALASALMPLVKIAGSGLAAAFSSLGDAFSKAVGPGASLGTTLSGLAKGLTSGLVSLIPTVVNIVGQLASALLQALPAVVGGVLKLLPALINGITSLLSQLLPMIPAILQQIVAVIVQVLPQVLTAIVNLITTVLPLIAQVLASSLPILITGAVQLFMGLITGLLQVLPQLITSLISTLEILFTTLVGEIPELINAALTLFLGIITALAKALPSIIQALINAIPTLITTIVNAIPLIINGALQFFLGAIQGLVKAIPQIIVAIITAIPQLIVALVSMLPQLIFGAIKLFLGIVTGLVKALPQIIKALLLAIPQMIKALIDAGPQFADAGVQLVKGLIGGLGSMVGQIVKAAENLAGTAINAVKNFLGIKSPSRKMRDEVGKMMGHGLIEGLKAMTGPVTDAMNDLVKLPNNGNMTIGLNSTGMGGSGYGYAARGGSSYSSQTNFAEGAIVVAGVSDPNAAAIEASNKIAEKVSL